MSDKTIPNIQKISAMLFNWASYGMALYVLIITACKFSSLAKAVIENDKLTSFQASVLAVIVFGWCGIIGAILYAFIRRDDS